MLSWFFAISPEPKADDAPDSQLETLATLDRTAIAVLPMANLSGDPEQQYFSDGMTEALITHLAKIRTLKVISRTSAMRFRGTNKPLPEIAQELGVGTILEGSVLKAGERVRITAQLIDATSDTHLWVESYERELSDILSLQGEVARAVARQIEVTLTPQEEARLVGRKTVSLAAHEAYLRGRYFWNQRGPGLRKSMEFFEDALAHDSDFALAHAGLADARALLAFYGYASPRDVMPEAKQAAQRALEIDESLGEAHASLGYILTMFDWKGVEADREFRRAIELNPSYGPARYWYSNLLMVLGRNDDALAEVRRGLEYDPLSVYMRTHLGVVLLAVHREEEACRAFVEALELEPDSFTTRSFLGLAYSRRSRVEDGIRELERALDSSGRNQWPLWTIGMVYAGAGDRERAEEVVTELESRARTWPAWAAPMAPGSGSPRSARPAQVPVPRPWP